MLNEIIQKVSEQAGISNEQATSAVTTVLNWLKEKLPAPIASHVDSLLSGSSSEDGGGVVGAAKGFASSLFNKE